jgi:hypothetical protein
MSYPAWQTATAYAVGTYVEQDSKVRICKSAHTSGTFATDDAAGKWAIAFESLTDRQKMIVEQYDQTARLLYETFINAHRIAMKLSVIHSQNSSLFLTTMYSSQNLPIPGASSVMATEGTTNGLNNARLAGETFIANNVSAKAIFRQMIGGDNCECLG